MANFNQLESIIQQLSFTNYPRLLFAIMHRSKEYLLTKKFSMQNASLRTHKNFCFLADTNSNNRCSPNEQ